VLGAVFGSSEEVLTLASLYSFGILISLMLANASIAWLRWTEPDMPRAFTMRGNVAVSGRQIPVPAVLGAIGAFAVWVLCLGTHEGARIVGLCWILGGLLIYAAVRIAAGLPLMSRVVVGEAPADELIGIPHRAIVVPLEKLDAMAEEVAATACRLASESDARVVGVSAIVVPVREPLEAPRPDRDEEAARVQAMARSLAGDYGVEYTGVVRRTRMAGRTVVDVATDEDAGLIVIGAPAKRRLAHSREEAFFGKTVDFVLRKAPCRVLVTHFPAGVAAEGEVRDLATQA
jgi:APA family basic amino acid/polyamine antiporter